jgi:hypothetical protein
VTSREDVTALAGRAIVTVRRRRAAGAAAAVLLLLLAAACNDDDDANPDVDEQPVLEVDTSTAEPVCMQVDESFPAEVERLPIIDCAKPHTHEIYATVESTEDVFPGVEALGDTAEVRCLAAFEPFVGTSPFDSVLSYTWLVPTLGSWNDEDDREILCVLMNRDGSPLVGSMRDSQV